MWEYMERRARRSAEYILQTGCTVRACASHFGISKSTVHKDVTERLAEADPELCGQVRAVLPRHPPQVRRALKKCRRLRFPRRRRPRGCFFRCGVL